MSRFSPAPEGAGKGSDGLADRGWVEVQKKTFTNWTNDKLKETDRHVDDLNTDLKDGVSLITLLQVLAPGKKMPGRHKKNPRMDIHKRENLDIAFQFLTTVEKVPLVNIADHNHFIGVLQKSDITVIELPGCCSRYHQLRDGLQAKILHNPASQLTYFRTLQGNENPTTIVATKIMQ